MRPRIHTFHSVSSPATNADTLTRAHVLHEIMRVSRDLCIGIGAFFISADGVLHTTLPDGVSTEAVQQRFRELAHGALVHPAVRDRTLFSIAEDPRKSTGRNFACVALPIWSDRANLGILGVVDSWLPELDEEQRSGLMALGRRLGDELQQLRITTPFDAPITECQETFLGEVLDHLPEGLLVTSSDGEVIMANRAFADMTGLTVSDLLGEDIAKVRSADTSAERWHETSSTRLMSRYVGECTVTLTRRAYTSRSSDRQPTTSTPNRG